jgi:hypothetical protein
MVSPPSFHANERSKADARIALFLTPEQIRWLTVGLGALPRVTRERIQRDIDQQLAAHGVLN